MQQLSARARASSAPKEAQRCGNIARRRSRRCAFLASWLLGDDSSKLAAWDERRVAAWLEGREKGLQRRFGFPFFVEWVLLCRGENVQVDGVVANFVVKCIISGAAERLWHDNIRAFRSVIAVILSRAIGVDGRLLGGGAGYLGGNKRRRSAIVLLFVVCACIHTDGGDRCS